MNRYSDGDGREVKRIAENCQIYQLEETECLWSGESSIYYIRSSVLGGEIISEAGNGGGKRVSYVRVGTSILAHLIRNYVWQQGGGYSYDAVYYDHTDSSGMSYRMTERQMPFGYGDYSDARQAEFDAGGTNVGLVNPNTPIYETPYPGLPPIEDTSPLWINGQRVTATLDGMAISWQMVSNLINSPRIGGEIGLSEILGRQSDANWYSNYRVKFNDGDRSYTKNFGNDLASAETFALRMNQTTIYAHLNVSNSAWFGFGSFPRPQTQPRKLTDEELKKTRKDVELILNIKGCSEFIQSILGLASNANNPVRSGTLLDLFDEIISPKQKGIFEGGTGGYGGLAIGAVGKGTGEIRVVERTDLNSTIPNIRRTQELIRASDVIAELIHHMGSKNSYSDEEMTTATADYMKVPEPDFSNSRLPYTGYSGWWHPKVSAKCPILSLINQKRGRKR